MPASPAACTLFASFIHPESLGFQTTILILTHGGGGRHRLGARRLAGALIFGLISELLRQALSFQEIIYGVILMGFMMFAPRGCSPAARARAARGGVRRGCRQDQARSAA